MWKFGPLTLNVIRVFQVSRELNWWGKSLSLIITCSAVDILVGPEIFLSEGLLSLYFPQQP